MSPALLMETSCEQEKDLLVSLSNALHDMSQPLTSVVFAIELSCLDDNDESRRMMLSSARTECNRVLDQVAHMRVLCEDLMHRSNLTRRVS